MLFQFSSYYRLLGQLPEPVIPKSTKKEDRASARSELNKQQHSVVGKEAMSFSLVYNNLFVRELIIFAPIVSNLVMAYLLVPRFLDFLRLFCLQEFGSSLQLRPVCKHLSCSCHVVVNQQVD